MPTLELMKVTNLPSSSSPCRARDEWVKAKAVTMGPNNFWKCDLKSVNLQYNKLVRWAEEKNDSSTKHLMFQVLFFFIICHRHRHHVGLGMSEWKRRPSQCGPKNFWSCSVYLNFHTPTLLFSQQFFPASQGWCINISVNVNWKSLCCIENA